VEAKYILAKFSYFYTFAFGLVLSDNFSA